MSPVVLAVLATLFLTWTLSGLYVYWLRGDTRYRNWQQYLRKNWPVFAPLNCFLYACTHREARTPFVDPALLPQLETLRANWQVFRDEGLALHQRGSFDVARTKGTPASYDVGFRTFYKQGWSRFYLHWYGYTHASALAECPRSVALLEGLTDVHAVMFSILPPRGQLTIHADPMACSLRWHLGLATPNSDLCFINVDGQQRSWRDGEGFIFDETYLHYVRNDTDEPRLILMCDVTRPMSWPGRLFNRFYRRVSRLVMTPNDSRDRRGPASAVFASVAPTIALGRRLHAHNPLAYAIVKWTVNGILLLVLLGLVAAAVWGLAWLFGAV